MYELRADFDGVLLAGDPYAWIPDDPANIDWQAYQQWLAAGNNPTPVQPPAVIVPQSVTRFQARGALQEAGLLDQVDAYFSALPGDDLHRLAWEEAPTVERASDATLAAATSLGLAGTQMDQLFIQAATY